MARLDLAIQIAADAFVDTYDKGGKPYILHCLHVMGRVKRLGEEAMIVGVLHDLLEDTSWTADMLVKAGFKERTVKMIEMLTHEKGEEYITYIKRVSLNDITRCVKMADLRHNSDIHRMKGLEDKDFTRLKKYHLAYDYLKKCK